MTIRQENPTATDAWIDAFRNEAFSRVSSNEWYSLDEDDTVNRTRRVDAKAV